MVIVSLAFSVFFGRYVEENGFCSEKEKVVDECIQYKSLLSACVKDCNSSAIDLHYPDCAF